MKISIIAGLVATLTLTSFSEGTPHKRITIHGVWNPDNPPHLVADMELRADRSYRIENNTPETISVLQVEIEWDALLGDFARTPRGFFTVLAGDSWEMEAPWNLGSDTYSLDFHLRGLEGSTKLNGRHGISITEGPELVTD